MLRVHLDDDRAAAVHPGVELARAVVELHLGVQRARRRIQRGREADDLARERTPGSASTSTWASLPTRTPASSRSLTVMNTRSASTRATVTIAPPPGGPTSVPGSSRRCTTTPVSGEVMRVSPRRTATAAICACAACCAASARRELRLRLLQLLLRHHRLGRQLLGAVVVRARQRRRRLRLRQRAARGGELVGQVAGTHQRQQLPARHPVAAIDEDGVEVAERLRPDVGLDQRPQVDRGAHLDRNVARLDPRDRHQRRRADLRLSGRLAAAPDASMPRTPTKAAAASAWRGRAWRLYSRSSSTHRSFPTRLARER